MIAKVDIKDELAHISDWVCGPGTADSSFQCIGWEQRWRVRALHNSLLLRTYTHITPKNDALIYPMVYLRVDQDGGFKVRYTVSSVKRRVISKISYIILSADDVSRTEYYVVEFSTPYVVPPHVVYGYMINACNAIALTEDHHVGPGAAARWLARQGEFALNA
jgi:hypothetical protein